MPDTDVFVDSTINVTDDVNMNWGKCTSLKVNSVEYLNNGIETIEEPLVRSVLSLTASKDSAQKRLDNQEIVVIYADKASESEESKANISIKDLKDIPNTLIQLYPAVDIYNNLGVLQSVQYDVDDTDMKISMDSAGNYLHEYFYSAVCYQNTETSPAANTMEALIYKLKSENKIAINSRDEYVVNSSDLADFTSLKINPITDGLYYSIFNSLAGTTKLYKSKKNAKNVIEPIVIDGKDFESLKQSGNVIYISKPKQLALYKYLADLDANIETIIHNAITDNKFDWLGKRNNSKIISSYNPLYSFFDTNNIYNQLTLAKIDFTEGVSEFNIVGSSKL